MAIFYITRGDKVIDRVEASSVDEAMDAAVVVTDGQFDDILDSKGYESFVSKRGAAEKQAMDKEIMTGRKSAIKEDSPTLSSLFPYTVNEMAETGDNAGFTAGLKDVGSLAGRAAYQQINPASGIGMTSEELAAQGNLGGAIMTDPLVGWSTALAPVGAALGGGAALGLGSTRAIPVAEILGSTVASTAPAPFLREVYGAKDLGIDALIGLAGGTVGTALAKLPKAAAFARMRQVLAREGVKDVTDETLEQVYTKLGAFRGTSKTAERAAERTAEKVPANILPQYSGPNAAARDEALEHIMPASAFDTVIEHLEQRAMLSPRDPRYLKESMVAGYKGRLTEAKRSYASIVGRAHKGKAGQYFDPQAYQAAVGEVLASVKDIPGAVQELSGGLSGSDEAYGRVMGRILRTMQGDEPVLEELGEGYIRKAVDSRRGLLRDAGALNAQGQLSRLYSPDAVQLNVLGIGKAMIADIPSAARSADAAVRAATMGGLEARKEYDLPYQTRLKDFYQTGESR